jgi:hypothetical protein
MSSIRFLLGGLAATVLAAGCGGGGQAPAAAATPTTQYTANAGPRVASFSTSGPVKATAGQVVSGLRISNDSGDCISIPAGANDVVVKDSEIGPCLGRAIHVAGANATIEHVSIHSSSQGVLAERTGSTVTRFSKFDALARNAIAYTYLTSGSIDGNVVTGEGYVGDVINFFESSNVSLTNNDINVGINCTTCAAFTLGDSTSGQPGSNFYAAGNVIRQRGNGVPAGIFGSEGNTLIEKNCFTGGIQAYNYSGVFVGVTVRNNVINLAQSYVPDPASISGWGTNVNSSDCSMVPR